MEEWKDLEPTKRNNILENTASFLDSSYEGTVFTFASTSAGTTESPRSKLVQEPAIPPTVVLERGKMMDHEMREMRESLMFPEVWQPRERREHKEEIISTDEKTKAFDHHSEENVEAKERSDSSIPPVARYSIEEEESQVPKSKQEEARAGCLDGPSEFLPELSEGYKDTRQSEKDMQSDLLSFACTGDNERERTIAEGANGQRAQEGQGAQADPKKGREWTKKEEMEFLTRPLACSFISFKTGASTTEHTHEAKFPVKQKHLVQHLQSDTKHANLEFPCLKAVGFLSPYVESTMLTIQHPERSMSEDETFNEALDCALWSGVREAEASVDNGALKFGHSKLNGTKESSLHTEDQSFASKVVQWYGSAEHKIEPLACSRQDSGLHNSMQELNAHPVSATSFLINQVRSDDSNPSLVEEEGSALDYNEQGTRDGQKVQNAMSSESHIFNFKGCNIEHGDSVQQVVPQEDTLPFLDKAYAGHMGSNAPRKSMIETSSSGDIGKGIINLGHSDTGPLQTNGLFIQALEPASLLVSCAQQSGQFSGIKLDDNEADSQCERRSSLTRSSTDHESGFHKGRTCKKLGREWPGTALDLVALKKEDPKEDTDTEVERGLPDHAQHCTNFKKDRRSVLQSLSKTYFRRNVWGTGGANTQSVSSSEDLFCQYLSIQEGRIPHFPIRLLNEHEDDRLFHQHLKVKSSKTQSAPSPLLQKDMYHEIYEPEAVQCPCNHIEAVQEAEEHAINATTSANQMWSKSLTTQLQQEELKQSDKMLQWEFGAEKKKCMSLDMKLTERPSLVHKGLDFLLQDINYVTHWGGVQKLVAKDESHSCKEPHATRRRKIPIVLRMKNGLRNGWLMQNWKRGTAKQIRQTEDAKLKGSIEGDIADAQKVRHTGTMNFQENQVFEVCPSNGEETQPGMEISPQQKLQSPQLFVLSKLDNYEAQLQVETDAHLPLESQSTQTQSDLELYQGKRTMSDNLAAESASGNTLGCPSQQAARFVPSHNALSARQQHPFIPDQDKNNMFLPSTSLKDECTSHDSLLLHSNCTASSWDPPQCCSGTVETTKNVNHWTSGVVHQNGSLSDAKAQLDDKPINSHSSQVRWTDHSLEESPQEQVFLEKFYVKRNDLHNHSYIQSFETPKPSGCGPHEQTVGLHRAYEPNASSCSKFPVASLLPNCSAIGSLQDVTERLCSTHKVESLSLLGGLDGHIHQDKAPVEKQPSPTVQTASLQTNKWPSSICHPQPQRPLNGLSTDLHHQCYGPCSVENTVGNGSQSVFLKSSGSYIPLKKPHGHKEADNIWQTQLTVPSLPCACPPPSQLPPEQFPAKSLSPQKQEALTASTCSHDSKQHPVLWLSQEELELICQLRQSSLKESIQDVTSLWQNQLCSRQSSREGPEDARCSMQHARPNSNTSSQFSDASLYSTDDSPTVHGQAGTQILRLGLEGSHGAAIVQDIRPSTQQLGLTTGHLMLDVPFWQGNLHCCKLQRAATTLQSFCRGHVVKCWYLSVKRAVHVIQRAWRTFLWRKRGKQPTIKQPPNTINEFYSLIKQRYISRHLPVPSFEWFVKSIERIQAATKGAKVRRRLKMRQTQTITMEIKEIQALLVQMSHETADESSPHFIPQLYRQLQHKVLQLSTVLNQTEAPFVRGRALLPSTTRQSKISLATLIKKLSEASALKGGRCLDASPNQATNIGKFHWYFSPSHSHPGSSPKPPRPLHGGQDRSFGKNGLHPSVLSKSETKKVQEEQAGCRGRSLPIDEAQSEFVQSAVVCKHKFLRRKSVVMSPRKVDWSKVKPVVHSHLEPELQSKLSRINKPTNNNHVSSKMIMRSNRNTKSHVFSYGAMSSPNSSRDGSHDHCSDPESILQQDLIKGGVPLEVKNSPQLQALHKASSPNQTGRKGKDVEVLQCNDLDLPLRTRVSVSEPELASPPEAQSTDPKNRYVHKIKDVGQLAQNPGTLDSDTRLPMMRMERKSKCKEEMREDMLSHPSSSLQEQTSLWGANAKYLTEHGTRKDIHSYRYANMRGIQQGYVAHVVARTEERIHQDDPLPEGGVTQRSNLSPNDIMGVASKELEKLYNDVMYQKSGVWHCTNQICFPSLSSRGNDLEFFRLLLDLLTGKSISLKSLFGQKSQYPPAKGHVEEESIIPSLHPASHIFQASFGQKNELHQVLKEEGRASNLQYDCLSFVSSHH